MREITIPGLIIIEEVTFDLRDMKPSFTDPKKATAIVKAAIHPSSKMNANPIEANLKIPVDTKLAELIIEAIESEALKVLETEGIAIEAGTDD